MLGVAIKKVRIFE